MKDDLLKIINNYGIIHQIKHWHGEIYELDEAIALQQMESFNLLEELVDIRNNIAEELADNLVMLKQFQYYYGIKDKEIEDIMKTKIERQLNRMENKDAI